MTLAEYLATLNTASATDGPWTEESGHAEALNGAFAEFAHALSKYVSTAVELVDYEIVRDSLEQVVHMFPATVEGPRFDTFEAIQAALLDAMGMTKEEADALLLGDALPDEPTEDMGK